MNGTPWLRLSRCICDLRPHQLDDLLSDSKGGDFRQ
jgi:hypothetical protein